MTPKPKQIFAYFLSRDQYSVFGVTQSGGYNDSRHRRQGNRQMKAAIWNGAASLDVVDVAKPDPRAGWVRLRVAACGVCGSDLHGFGRPEMGWSGMRPGHEISGYVDAVGEGVVLDYGGLMAVEPMDGCGHCVSCGTGHYNLCSDVELAGFVMYDFIPLI